MQKCDVVMFELCVSTGEFAEICSTRWNCLLSFLLIITDVNKTINFIVISDKIND